MPRAGTWGIRLAFAALLLRALLPAGFMPAAAAHGVAVVICTGHGPVSAGIGNPEGTPPADAGHDCPFAGLNAPGDLPLATAAALPKPAYTAATLSLPTSASPAPPLAAPRPPATGPPPAL